jgi:hypothetical protein
MLTYITLSYCTHKHAVTSLFWLNCIGTELKIRFLYLMLQYNSHQCWFRCMRCLVWVQASLTTSCWRFSAKPVFQFSCQYHCTSASYSYFIHLLLANRILITGSIIKWNTYSVFLQPFQVMPEEYITVVSLYLPHYIPYLTRNFFLLLKFIHVHVHSLGLIN